MTSERKTYDWIPSKRYQDCWELWEYVSDQYQDVLAQVFPALGGDGFLAEVMPQNDKAIDGFLAEIMPQKAKRIICGTVQQAKRAAEAHIGLSIQPDAAARVGNWGPPPVEVTLREDLLVDRGPRSSGAVAWVGNVPLIGLWERAHYELLTGTARIIHHHRTGGRPHTYVYVIERADGRFEMHVTRVDREAKTASTEAHPMSADELDRLAARLGLQPWHIGHRAPANDVGNTMETAEATQLSP